MAVSYTGARLLRTVARSRGTHHRKGEDLPRAVVVQADKDRHTSKGERWFCGEAEALAVVAAAVPVILLAACVLKFTSNHFLAGQPINVNRVA